MMNTIHRKYQTISDKLLHKKADELCFQDSKTQNAPGGGDLENMSTVRSTDFVAANDSKVSRIRFSSDISKIKFSSDASGGSFSDKENVTGGRSLSKINSEDTVELLDSANCYHAQCSFAYNLTGDVRRDSLITECLPSNTYQRLAELWGLDRLKTPRKFGNTCKIQNVEEEDEEIEEYIKNVEKDLGIRRDVSEDLQVNFQSVKRSDFNKIKIEVKDNPYLKFLKTDGGLDVEHKNKENLRKKATKITKMIIKNFLDWYQSLGGNDGETVIDELTLQELFQIGFEFPAAKAMLIKVKEMPTVPDALAAMQNEPKHATSYALRQFLKQDIIKENIPTKMVAFGRMLPKGSPSLRYKPPSNNVRETWMECSRVPKELDTMETIWVGLEGLRSTIAFSNWLKDHPEIKPPTYLQEKGLLQINYEEWNQMYKGFELEVDTVEAVVSEAKEGVEEKVSVQESKEELSESKKSDSEVSF